MLSICFTQQHTGNVWLDICRIRSESEAQKHMRRRRKRKREKISKAQGAADSAEPDSQAAASAAEGGDDAAGKEEEDEKLTAADELAPMQVSSKCHSTSSRLQCCSLCFALHQHGLNWLNCCYMHNGSACCNMACKHVWHHKRMCMHHYATIVRVMTHLYEVSIVLGAYWIRLQESLHSCS